LLKLFQKKRIHPSLAQIAAVPGVVDKFFPDKGLQVQNALFHIRRITVPMKPGGYPLLFFFALQTGAGMKNTHVPGPQYIKGAFEQKRGVNTAGKSHAHPTVAGEYILEFVYLLPVMHRQFL
jgi:hypothetical protein